MDIDVVIRPTVSNNVVKPSAAEEEADIIVESTNGCRRPQFLAFGSVVAGNGASFRPPRMEHAKATGKHEGNYI